jgi:hypothetical protein
MKITVLGICALFILSACTGIFEKSEFECFNKTDISLTYSPKIQEEKYIKNHLDDYHDQFIKYYENIFEKLDNQSSIIGLLGKVGSSIWNGKGLISIENRHKTLPEQYNKEVLELVNDEIKKINIMIHYTYNERIESYRSTIPKEGEPLNTENVHPRFFLFSFNKKDDTYNKWIDKTNETLRKFETNLTQIRYRKAYRELYLNSSCDLSPLENELLAYINNPNANYKYEYEIKKLGLNDIVRAWDLNDKLVQQMDLWNEDKVKEFERFKISFFTNLEKEIETLFNEVNMDSEYVDLIREESKTNKNKIK